MPGKTPERIKEPASDIDDEVKRYGMTKRRLEPTRCSRCLGQMKVSASVLLRVARGQSSVVCGACLGEPGAAREISQVSDNSAE